MGTWVDRNLRFLYVLQALRGGLFIMPIIVVYWQDLGLSTVLSIQNMLGRLVFALAGTILGTISDIRGLALAGTQEQGKQKARGPRGFWTPGFFGSGRLRRLFLGWSLN